MKPPEIIYFSPWNTKGNIAQSYNECMALLDDHQWGCFMDMDTIPCPHESFGFKLETYILEYPEAVLFTAMTNRIGRPEQRADVDRNSNDIEYHRQEGRRIEERDCFEVEEDKSLFSGILMLCKKKHWTPIKLNGMTGIDNAIHDMYKSKGKCYIMKGVYLYHWYGWQAGTDKRKTSHLKNNPMHD